MLVNINEVIETASRMLDIGGKVASKPNLIEKSRLICGVMLGR
jgi:hypothetical protein